MKASLGLFTIFSLVILMIIPVHAEVTTATLDKENFTIDDKFTITGTVDDPNRVTLLASMKGPSVEKLTRTAMSDNDGTFSFVPVLADDLFRTDGVYEINIFTELQVPGNGTKIKIGYDDGIATLLPDYDVELNEIGNKIVKETEKLSFTAKISDSDVDNEEFSLDNAPSGATINKDTGAFSWTPTQSQSGGYIIDIIVKAGPLEDKETITVTVTDKPVTTTQPEPIKEPEPVKEPEPISTEPKELGLASFVDATKDPQSYVDRYNNEETYKKWFDDNFAEYDSIYQAVGLEEPLLIPASFVDATKDPQSYVDRYNNEETYKKWFDDNFAEYGSIYQAVGLEEPKIVASFVDPNLDPQYYVDRYNNEITYKEWFDETYPDMTIHEAVGLKEETTDEVVEEFGECGEGTDLIDGMCTIIDNSQGGGCLIATATYGTEMAPQVQLLREIRDSQLTNTNSGIVFMTGFNSFYYSFSPYIADLERENPMFREAVKVGITPLLSSLTIMTHAETESEVVGYGIGVILMNLGMYVAAPAMIVFKTRKYIRM